MKKYIFLFIFSCVLVQCYGSSAVTWNGNAGDGDWFNKSNWSPVMVPLRNNHAVFPAGTPSCTISGTTIVDGIVTEAGYTGVVTLSEQAQLWIGYTGIIVNAGTFRFGEGCFIKTWGSLKVAGDGIIRGLPVSTVTYGSGDFFSNTELFALDQDQLDNRNLIFTQTFLTPVTSETQIPNLSFDKVIEQTTFFDPFGRPIEKVARKLSAVTEKDLVSIKAYDQYGLEAKQYLPYVSKEGNGAYKDVEYNSQNNAYTQQQNFYTQNTDPTIAASNRAFAETVFEPSQLGRALEASAAGEAWQVLANGAGHTQKAALRGNNAAEVKFWHYDETNGNATSDFYFANTVAVSQQTDENGKTSTMFTDMDGLTVMKLDADLATYYIYDYKDRLVYIVPPAAASLTAISGSNCFATATSTEYKLLFGYKYDGRDRLITKKVPGAVQVNIVYDQLDRPALTQDGNKAAINQWSFTKYDVMSRPVQTGLYTDSRTASVIKSEYTTATVFYENRTVTNTIQGYTKNVFPKSIASSDLLSVSYYDDYDFDNNTLADYSYQNSGLGTDEPVPFIYVTGLPTGTKVKNMETGTWLISANFYDKKLRPIQSQSNNHIYMVQTGDLTSLKDVNTIVYDFSGSVSKSKQLHTPSNVAASIVAVNRRYSYDHAKRLKNSWQQINNTAEVLVSTQRYNELGQLIEKNLHSEDKGGSFLQSVDYRYNIRGWLTGINNSSLSNDGGQSNNDDNDLFGMSFSYEGIQDGLGNTARFNGDISAVQWKTNNPDLNPISQEQAYNYNYDGHGRLTDAFSAMKSTANIWQSTSKFNESGITYDLNGNIKTLSRTDRNGSSVDLLSYTYSGNQLTKVGDAGMASTGVGFRSGSSADEQYTYDANGNLLADANKKFSYIYNYLDLIVSATNTGGNPGTIIYNYDAAGTKLKKTVSPQGAMAIVTHYVDNFIYSQDGQNYTLQAMMTEEGRVTPNSGSFTYEYTLSDHQGNARINFDKDPSSGKVRVIQESHYYAFGLKRSDASTSGLANEFLYSNKELQDELDLNQYDYGFRQYDAVLGRWHAQDALADGYHDMSPYHFSLNNPVNFGDSDGRKIYIAGTKNGVAATFEFTPNSAVPDGASDFVKNVFKSLNHVYAADKKNVINEFVNSDDKNVTIEESSDLNGSYNHYTNKILWNPSMSVYTKDRRGRLNGGKQPAALVLYHELVHGYRHQFMEDEYWVGLTRWRLHYDNKEEKSVIEDYETPVAEALNYGTRVTHSGAILMVDDPLSIKEPSPNSIGGKPLMYDDAKGSDAGVYFMGGGFTPSESSGTDTNTDGRYNGSYEGDCPPGQRRDD